MKAYILGGWQSYRRTVGEIKGGFRGDEKELKEAYFAGAAVLFEELMTSLDPGEEPTDADLRKMEAILKELSDFGREIDRKYARKLLKRQRRHRTAGLN